MQRAFKVLVAVLAVVVIAAAGYVISHQDPVPGAGTVPSGSAVALTPDTSSASTDRVPQPTAGVLGTSAVAVTSNTGAPSNSRAAAPPRVAFVGDNYTAGDGASATAASWPTLVADALGVTGRPFAVSGGGYAKPDANGKTYLSLVAPVVAYRPDVVVVSGGRNDTGDDPTTLAAHARQLFRSLHARLPAAKIVAVAPWWGDSPHPPELSTVDDAVRSGVTAAGGTYLAVDDVLIGHPAWMADAANPNDAGYRHLAGSVTAALRAARLLR